MSLRSGLSRLLMDSEVESLRLSECGMGPGFSESFLAAALATASRRSSMKVFMGSEFSLLVVGGRVCGRTRGRRDC